MPSKATETRQAQKRVKTPLASEKAVREAHRKPMPTGISVAPSKARAGRKSLLLDKERLNKLIDAFVAGNTVRNACNLAGIGEATYFRWVQEADSAPERNELWEFRESVKKAMATAEHRNVMVVQQAASKTWQAAAWWLERRYPKDWGRRDRMAVGGDADAPPILHAPVSGKLISDPVKIASIRAILKRAEERAMEEGKSAV